MKDQIMEYVCDNLCRFPAEYKDPDDLWNEQCDRCRLRELLAEDDVRPVVRGTWVGIDDFPHEDWECDHCGCVVGNTDDPWNYYHFCPNCGADMREES